MYGAVPGIPNGNAIVLSLALFAGYRVLLARMSEAVVLLYTRRAQRIAWAVLGFFFLLLFVLPFGILVLAAFTRQ